jgi:thioredoxin reductase (NADPH)
VPRSLAIVILTLPVIRILTALVFLVLPAAVAQLGEVIEQLPVLLENVADFAEAALARLALVDIPLVDEEQLIAQLRGVDDQAVVAFLEERRAALGSWAWEGFLGIGRGLGTVLTIASYVVLTPVLTFYLLRDWDNITHTMHGLLPHGRREGIVSFATDFDHLLSRYLRGQITVALAVGAITGMGLWIAQFPYAATLGLIVAVFSVVPYLGLLLSLVPALLIALVSGAVWLSLLKVLIVYGVAQGLEGAVISPRIVGESVGLHPVWVVLALAMGGFFFGFVGLLMRKLADDVSDITIIGGGPTGLFAAFYSGMRGSSTRIIDSLPELGGQLTALYPEKDIFDVGGFPRVLAKDLATDLVKQGLQFGPDVVLDVQVREVERADDHFVLHCSDGRYLTRTIVVAGGKGAFEPMVLPAPGYEEFLHRGIEYPVKDPELYRDKKVVIVGGGDSALDWVVILKDIAAELTLVHRRDGWRAHELTVQKTLDAAEAGEIDLRTFHEVREIRGSDAVEGITLFDNRTDEDFHLDVDVVLTFLGFKPDLGPIKNWGLEVEKNRIKVDSHMGTNVPGIYAAGDIVSYEGKLDLIATGFAEAAVAVNNAVHFVDPSARVNPGHSTSSKAFK